jgi:EAL domain-containing protein (putative c-di-GMP-specific phosphodiesterase class I)
MRVAATGVDNADQLAVLATLGCDDYQGALFCAPLPAPELQQLLEHTTFSE